MELDPQELLSNATAYRGLVARWTGALDQLTAANECIENFLDSDLANLMLKSETTLTGSHVNRAGARKCFSYL